MTMTTLRRWRATLAAGAARGLAVSREPAISICAILTLTTGAMLTGAGNYWVGVPLSCLGIIALWAAKDADVERARHDGYLDALSTLMNSNGASIEIIHRTVDGRDARNNLQ